MQVRQPTTHRERWNHVYAGLPADGIPITEMGYWEETIQRWQGEGLQAGLNYELGKVGADDLLARALGLDYGFHANRVACDLISMDPPFETELITDDGDTVTVRDEQGIVSRNLKSLCAMPQFVRFPVESRQDFDKLKDRYSPSSEVRYGPRYVEYLRRIGRHDYPLIVEVNGFFGALRNWMGLERLCTAYYDDPDLVDEMSEFWAGFLVGALQRVLADVELDNFCIWEDLSYKNGPLISPQLFRRFISPHYRRVIDLVRGRGVPNVMVDTDGNIEALVPLFEECGVNGVYPMEVQAGNDMSSLQKQHPDFTFMGGVDKRELAKGRRAIDAELERIRPFVEAGRYIPFVDHHVPPDVSLDDFRYYVDRKRELFGWK